MFRQSCGHHQVFYDYSVIYYSITLYTVALTSFIRYTISQALFGASRWLLLQECSTTHGPLNVKNYYTFFIISSLVLLRMINVSGKSCRENQNKHFTFNNFLSRQSCRLWDNVQKYCTARRTPDDSMAHAHCMLDTWGYKHTQGM